MTRSKFGTIIDCGNEKYRCRWSDVTGKKRSHYVHGTRRDAELYLAKMEMQLYGCPDNVTYADYWETTVLPQIRTLELKTQYEYIRMWDGYLEEPLGSRMVATTNYRWAQTVIDSIDSPSQQRHVAALWKKICNMAVRDGILPANPVQRMTYKKLVRKKKVILDHKSVVSYIQQILASKYAHIVLLEMCAGLRHEEACAISKEDLEKRNDAVFININKARVCVNGAMIEKETKNEVSTRSVPITGIYAELLLSCDIVPLNPQTVTHNFRTWCKRHEVQYIPPGNMRSNFATIAGECCDGGLVDLYMGHSGRSTMDRWYRASTEAGMLIVAQAFEQYTTDNTGLC